MSNGNGITGLTLTDSGDLYIANPIVIIGLPNAPTLTAQATASLDSGSVGSITLDSAGTYYTAVPNITIEAPPSGTTATATATYANGRITSVSITDSGDGYLTAPSVTIAAPTGSPGDFKASAGANVDLTNEKIESLYIIDSGDFYITPPSITISEPISTARFIIGENINQEAYSDGTMLTGEVAAYSDSGDQLSLIHVGTTAANGAFHEPTSGFFITGQESFAKAKIVQVVEQTVIGDQALDFAAEIEEFVDFSEVNPFGEIANSEALEH